MPRGRTRHGPGYRRNSPAVSAVDVTVEVGRRKAFASALEWPGWCRSGRDEQAALEALLDYRDRFDVVAAGAGLDLPSSPNLRVVERVENPRVSSFGAPYKRSVHEAGTVPSHELALLESSWRAFDGVIVARAVAWQPARRGGRDQAAIEAHVHDVERAYARSVGVRSAPAEFADPAVVRRRFISALRGEAGDRYWVRRATWHVLDHMWEIEDRSISV